MEETTGGGDVAIPGVVGAPVPAVGVPVAGAVSVQYVQVIKYSQRFYVVLRMCRKIASNSHQ